MTNDSKPLLIKRYASRRLYNTETSDYVTLDDIAKLINKGRDVQIIDLKSGDDLTRQYLLQIVTDHESRGENVLPVDVLTDLVRSYASNMQSIVPGFLAASFEMLRENQSQMLEKFSTMQNPMNTIPGFESIRQQQEAFIKTMMGNITGGWPSSDKKEAKPQEDTKSQNAPQNEDIAEIKKQLSELQKKLSNL